MNVADIQPLRTLTGTQFQEVISDLQLRKAGTKIYFCVDPHEIYDFCFPVDLNTPKSPDIDLVANDQIALYETFYNLTNHPILLPEYRAELDALTRYLELVVARAYKTEEMLKRLVQDAQLEAIPHVDDVTASHSEVANRLNVYLAIALATSRLGMERFIDVTKHRLQLNVIDKPIAELWSSYKRSEMADEIYKTVAQKIEASAQRQGRRQSDIERQLRSAQYDSAAADRLLYLNSAAGDPPKQLFLYLSSANRSESIFHHAAVKKMLPVIGGKEYSIWRTRSQMFAYVISKGYAAPDRLQEEAIQNLKRAQHFLAEPEATTEFCAVCILKDGSGQECDRADNCRSVASLADEIRRRRDEIINLGLIGALKSYKEILDRKAPRDEVLRSIVELLRRLSTNETRETVLQTLQGVRLTVSIQTEFFNALKRGLASWQTYANPEFLRQGRDSVVSAAQYLPNRPRINNPIYKPIVDKIIDFYETPATGGHGKSTRLDAAYREYLELDAQQANALMPEHELVRCLLYLALPEREADVLALKHARMMIRRCVENPQADREFRYVAGWAARRARKYPVANQILRAAMDRYPDDPRFAHGLSLSIFAWTEDTKVTRKPKHTLKHAIELAEKAVAQYEELRNDAYAPLIAASYNNIAYFRALRNDADDLVRSRDALRQLKQVIAPERWDIYPEYFHTEAWLEFQEAVAAKKRKDIERAQKKLGWALDAIEHAIQLNPHDSDYANLRRSIKLAQKELDVEVSNIRVPPGPEPLTSA